MACGAGVEKNGLIILSAPFQPLSWVFPRRDSVCSGEERGLISRTTDDSKRDDRKQFQ